MSPSFHKILAFAHDKHCSYSAAKVKVTTSTASAHKPRPLEKFMSSSLFGYRKVFEQYAAILQQKYPYLAIEGDNYPPPFPRQKMAQLLGILKILLILLVVSGTNIFGHLGVTTPSVWEWTQQNKFYACLMTFFLCNAIEGQLISTGAFEIILNDVPLWSKLETGRIPQPPELFQMIDNHINMANPPLSLDS
uniref:EOG090X0DP2 n=1 Tax=Simocephalus serrulatus TaxID=117539 RepID=A0A4Y7NMR8_9CRUS|nr:EOG090X0DP2 [Simocephalus serrulatus]SVE94502.1 EOG090X0DP2 [Simocephalus serrulatus]